MKYIKTYELFGASKVTKALLRDIEYSFSKWTELHIAIVENDFKNFKTYLNIYDDLEIIDRYGDTPLLLASRNGRIKMMEELIKKGVNIYHKNRDGYDFYDLAKNSATEKWIETKFPEFKISKKYNL